MSLRDQLEKVGGILAGGWGDKVAMGALFRYLDEVTPYQCYEYIRDNQPLLGAVSNEDWDLLQEFAQKANLTDITSERVIQEFRKHRPDLFQVIVNDPRGRKWLESQVAILRQKLGLETA